MFRPRNGARESKRLQGNREIPDTPAVMATSTSTTTTQPPDLNYDPSSHPEALPGSDLLDSLRPPNAQVSPGPNLLENEQQEMSEIRQPAQDPSPLKDQYRRLKAAHRQLLHIRKLDLEAHKLELQRTHGEMRNVKDYTNELHHENQRLKEQMGSLQKELNNVHQQLEDAKTLSEVRGKELSAAQAFLTKADTLSISKVSEKVTALNAEIFLAVVTLGSSLIHQHYELSQEDLDVANADSREMVGEKITNFLISQAQKPEHELNPFLVQVVLQIIMVKFCVSKIQSWYPSDFTIGEFLNAIYTTIRSSEEQAVSGRWRALTRAHTRPSTEIWADELSQKLMAVFKIAAWMPLIPENQDYFENQCLPRIFEAVNELRLIIGENFTSADLDVSIFDSGTLYEPSYMEDAYSDGRQKQAPEFVFGTTGIGLRKFMGECDADDNLMFQSVTSAKVVLESTLKEALEPSGRLAKKKIPIDGSDR